MLRFAVIGNPIAHSLSPVIHQGFAKQCKLDLSYEKIQGDEEHFESQIRDFFAAGGRGLNVTLPFKERAFKMAQASTPRAKLAKAGNTFWMKDGLLWIDNTDGIGLIRDLRRHLSLEDKRMLILGAGGAARGIIGPLIETKPASLLLASRSLDKIKPLEADFPELSCLPWDKLEGEFDLIIHATSAMMREEDLTLPAICFRNKAFCYDLSYKQIGLTAFVDYAKRHECPAADGLGMLVEQAAEAFYIWHGLRPLPDSILRDLSWERPPSR